MHYLHQLKEFVQIRYHKDESARFIVLQIQSLILSGLHNAASILECTYQHEYIHLQCISTQKAQSNHQKTPNHIFLIKICERIYIIRGKWDHHSQIGKFKTFIWYKKTDFLYIQKYFCIPESFKKNISTRFLSTKLPFEFFVLVLWIHKDYFVVKKLEWKTFW